MLEPRTRAVEPETLMESLFRLTELEARVSVNMNVLVDGVTPRVVSLGEALRQWLDHRRNVLVRRSRHRLAAIDKRLELLAGMIIVFLNLDEVIRIVREDDDPKEALKARFGLSELQAVYVLDTRLRSLRRLEEMALRKEQDELSKEKATIEALLASEKKQWQMIAVEIRDVKKKFGPDTKLGRRRTSFEAAPDVIVSDLAEAMIEREPLTIVVSQKGWIRAMKGQVADLSTRHIQGRRRIEDRVLRRNDLEDSGAGERRQGVHTRGFQAARRTRAGRADPSHGRHRRDRFDRRRLGLCGGRETPHRVERRQRLHRRRGRASVLDPQGQGGAQRHRPATAALIVSAAGDHVAIIGQNRKLLVFPFAQLNEMARGKGTRLQRYKDGGLSDAKVFAIADGLTWRNSAGRTFTVARPELKEWIGNRAEAGRLPPKGFPKSNRFEG